MISSNVLLELRQISIKLDCVCISDTQVIINVNANDWSTMSVSKLAYLLKVAEAALDVAKDHAAAQHSAALTAFWVELSLLLLAVAFSASMMLLVSRRVTSPLSTARFKFWLSV